MWSFSLQCMHVYEYNVRLLESMASLDCLYFSLTFQKLSKSVHIYVKIKQAKGNYLNSFETQNIMNTALAYYCLEHLPTAVLCL